MRGEAQYKAAAMVEIRLGSGMAQGPVREVACLVLGRDERFEAGMPPQVVRRLAGEAGQREVGLRHLVVRVEL